MKCLRGVFLFAILTAPLWAQPPADTTFRTSAKLVQVSVVAQDKDGKPVADLRREDFQISDNGAPRQIRLFLSEASSAPAPQPRAPNTFTNQIALPEGSRSGYSVLLFDNLNTGFEHTARARIKALRALDAIPAGDRIALYSLWCQFQVIREFTSDRESLARQLHAFKPAAGAPCSIGAGDNLLPSNHKPSMADLVNPQGGVTETRAAAETARIGAVLGGSTGDLEMQQIADHLSGIPGRKNLIWIAQSFALTPATLGRLIDAGVAIYPVDAIGSTVALEVEKEEHAAPLLALAKATGGVAYIDRDDLDVAIRESLDDGRISYTLGFYQADEQTGADTKARGKRGRKPQPDVHRLSIQVTRPGVTLRYRTGYQIEPAQPRSENPVADMVQAMNRPVDSTSIALTASATRRQGRLDLSVSFDIASLDLALDRGLWKGNAEVLVRFMAADGVWAGEVISQTVAFNLRPATYASMLQNGAAYHKEIAIPAKAVELKLLVGNPASGKMGTLTIPLNEVGQGIAKAK